MAALAALDSLSVTLKSLDIGTIKQSEWDEIILLSRTLHRLDSLRDRGIDRSEINELEAKIRDAAWKLQDVIEVYQLSDEVEGVKLQDDKGVEQEILSFFNTAKKLREEYEGELDKEYDGALEKSRVAVAEEDHIIHDAANSTTVGLSDLSQQIITKLQNDSDRTNVITIWGMAGIGKTHLARDIYHHPLVVQHFKLRLWLNIGPIHKDIKNIFVDILAQIERKHRDLFKEKDERELRELVWNNLSGQTYLIVLDDIWSPSVMNDFIIDRSLPDRKSHQNILLTTRLRDVHQGHIAYTPTSFFKIWQMPFLSEEESWNLLSQNVFAEKPFPTQLEKPGRKIAQTCEGLPLLILTVAGILRGLDQTEEYWNKVAEKKTTTFPDAYDQIYKVLVLSYDYLLQQYKACFLYMGVFRQSHEILASKLFHLWSVENILGTYQTLNVFVSSSISLVNKHRSNSRIKSCKLHSTYWYVCITEARKIKLFHVLNKLADVFIESPRRLSVQNNMLFGLKEVNDSMAAATSLTRSLLFTGEDHQYPVHICFNTMLLMKVLDALAIRFYEFPNEVLNLLQLRYLTLTHNGEVPSSISKLQQLRFLILRRHHNIKLMKRESTTYLPNEIWVLKKLRYLRIMGSNMPDPSGGVKLQELSRLYVNANNCTECVLRGTPNLLKLGIEIELRPEGGTENSLRCLEHIGLLKRLNSLKCVVVNPRMSSQVVAPPDHLSNLPKSLKKLSLKGMGYPWRYMSVIGSLDNLQVLKLRCFAFRGAEWETKDGEFPELEYLLLEDMDVVHWTAKNSLPHLRSLFVRHCYKLKTSPLMTLLRTRYVHGKSVPHMDMIEVDECSPSVMEEIRGKSRYSYPKVEINCSWNL